MVCKKSVKEICRVSSKLSLKAMGKKGEGGFFNWIITIWNTIANRGQEKKLKEHEEELEESEKEDKEHDEQIKGLNDEQKILLERIARLESQKQQGYDPKIEKEFYKLQDELGALQTQMKSMQAGGGAVNTGNSVTDVAVAEPPNIKVNEEIVPKQASQDINITTVDKDIEEKKLNFFEEALAGLKMWIDANNKKQEKAEIKTEIPQLDESLKGMNDAALSKQKEELTNLLENATLHDDEKEAINRRLENIEKISANKADNKDEKITQKVYEDMIGMEERTGKDRLDEIKRIKDEQGISAKEAKEVYERGQNELKGVIKDVIGKVLAENKDADINNKGDMAALKDLIGEELAHGDVSAKNMEDEVKEEVSGFAKMDQEAIRLQEENTKKEGKAIEAGAHEEEKGTIEGAHIEGKGAERVAQAIEKVGDDLKHGIGGSGGGPPRGESSEGEGQDSGGGEEKKTKISIFNKTKVGAAAKKVGLGAVKYGGAAAFAGGAYLNNKLKENFDFLVWVGLFVYGLDRWVFHYTNTQLSVFLDMVMFVIFVFGVARIHEITWSVIDLFKNILKLGSLFLILALELGLANWIGFKFPSILEGKIGDVVVYFINRDWWPYWAISAMFSSKSKFATIARVIWIGWWVSVVIMGTWFAPIIDTVSVTFNQGNAAQIANDKIAEQDSDFLSTGKLVFNCLLNKATGGMWGDSSNCEDLAKAPSEKEKEKKRITAIEKKDANDFIMAEFFQIEEKMTGDDKVDGKIIEGVFEMDSTKDVVAVTFSCYIEDSEKKEYMGKVKVSHKTDFRPWAEKHTFNNIKREMGQYPPTMQCDPPRSHYIEGNNVVFLSALVDGVTAKTELTTLYGMDDLIYQWKENARLSDPDFRYPSRWIVTGAGGQRTQMPDGIYHKAIYDYYYTLYKNEYPESDLFSTLYPEASVLPITLANKLGVKVALTPIIPKPVNEVSPGNTIGWAFEIQNSGYGKIKEIKSINLVLPPNMELNDALVFELVSEEKNIYQVKEKFLNAIQDDVRKLEPGSTIKKFETFYTKYKEGFMELPDQVYQKTVTGTMEFSYEVRQPLTVFSEDKGGERCDITYDPNEDTNRYIEKTKLVDSKESNEGQIAAYVRATWGTKLTEDRLTNLITAINSPGTSDIEPAFVLALMKQEAGSGPSELAIYCHNWGGIKEVTYPNACTKYPAFAEFGSDAAFVQELYTKLAKNYVPKGQDTLHKVANGVPPGTHGWVCDGRDAWLANVPNFWDAILV